MHFVGVDLAWGPRNRTGLAVLDGNGRLLDLRTAVTDQEILAWLRPWTAGPCLVAIDAPLVVPNASGQRRCESLVGRYFGRQQAFAHSSNRGNPHFAPVPRALGLADALDLDVDPQSPGARRAVEVYPHPALVSLFDLPVVLRYKNKPGRDLELLRSETLRLLDLMDGLATAAVPLVTAGAPAGDEWRRIRQVVTGAGRKSELRRVEDGIDAVVAAYIALYATVAPEHVRVIGTGAEGYILTPVAPEVAVRIDRDGAVGWVPPSRPGTMGS
jgi:predicted RNase H-like nuclease